MRLFKNILTNNPNYAKMWNINPANGEKSKMDGEKERGSHVGKNLEASVLDCFGAGNHKLHFGVQPNGYIGERVRSNN